MKKMKWIQKGISALLALNMVLSLAPLPVFAGTTDNLCEHHTEHSAEVCGYVEAVQGQPCNHQCGEDCTVTACVHDHEAKGCVYTPARDLVLCDHVHDETCNYNEAEDTCDHQHGECAYQEPVEESWDCAHVCTVDSGCVKTRCAHVCPEDDCGFVAAAGHECEFVCTECKSQGDSEDDESNPVQTVDFMELLEDDTILIAFQSGADIDLHDYLVNAYSIPGEIPFTCDPAVVSYGEYEDGSLISVTITAGEGYEGSCTVEAEVRYMNAFDDYRVYPTVTYLVNQNANYSDAVGKKLLSVTIQAERECWHEFYEVDGNSYTPFNGIFQDGFSPDFTIRVYVRSNEKIQAGIGVNDWGRQGDGRAIYKDFTFHFQNSPYVNLPDVTWTNYQRDWLYPYYNKVDLPYTGKLQDFATVDSYSNGDVTKENCSGIGAGTYTAKVTVKLNDGLSALDSQSPDYAGIKWQEEAQESGRKVYTKTNTVTIVPVNPTVTTTPGSLTINASTEYTPADLVADSGAGIQVTGVGDDGILPANISYTWSDGTSAAKVPGTSETIKATITPTGPLAQNYNTVTASVTVNVTKKITGKSYETKSREYNGMGQNLAIVNWSDSGVLYTIVYQDSQGNTYSGSDLPVCVDEYTVSVQLSDGWLFEDGTTKQDLPRKAEITPKSVRLTDIEVAEKVYDGTNTAEDIGTFAIDGILAADKADVTHHANYTFEDKNVGNWSVAVSDIALGGSKAKNYALLDGSGMPVTDWTTRGAIKPKSVIVTANDLSKTYGAPDPEKLTYTTENVVEGETLVGITLSRAEGENAGSYTINVNVDQAANPNYTVTPKNGTFTIKPKELTVSLTVAKQFDNTTGVDKEKDTFAYELKGLVGDDPVGLSADAVTAVFEKADVDENIEVTLAGDFALTGAETVVKNYTLTQPSGVTGRIYNTYDAAAGTDFKVSHGGWTNGDVTITAGANRFLAREIEGEWTAKLTYSDQAENRDGKTAAFFVKNTDNGDISLQETVTYKIDKTNPTGTIALENRTPWQELVSNITFGLFFNYEQTVTITAADTLSGIAKVEYLESDKALDQTVLKALESESWKEYASPIPVALEDLKQFVYYAKITDEAGNVIYLSTNGAEYDTTDPVVAGITAGETYYITKPVTVTDSNLLSTTLTTGTGEPAVQTVPFNLPGNVDAVYTIAASDKAGNQTVLSVTMKPVETMDDALDAGESPMTVDNVKLSDKTRITAILNQAEALMEETDVASEDEALQKIVDRMQTLLDAIAAAEAVIEQIKALPGADKAQPDNKDHLEALLKTQAAYNQLSANGKTMVGADNKAVLDGVATALHTYRIIAGDGGKHTKHSGKTLSFTANGPVKLELSNGKTISFKGILVDGAAVAAGNYTVVSGSTVVTLKSSYLDSLKGGKHKIVFLYDHMGTEYRTNEASFRVSIPSDNPKTGDDLDHLSRNGLTMTGLLCVAMLVLLFPGKKGKYQR